MRYFADDLSLGSHHHRGFRRRLAGDRGKADGGLGYRRRGRGHAGHSRGFRSLLDGDDDGFVIGLSRETLSDVRGNLADCKEHLQ